jgi:hypothetical protein
VAIEA